MCIDIIFFIYFQLAMGIFRLGFITVYLSDPLISGFTTAAAVHVVTSQIKNIFGVTTDQYSGTFKLIWVSYAMYMNQCMAKPTQ